MIAFLSTAVPKSPQSVVGLRCYCRARCLSSRYRAASLGDDGDGTARYPETTRGIRALQSFAGKMRCRNCRARCLSFRYRAVSLGDDGDGTARYPETTRGIRPLQSFAGKMRCRNCRARCLSSRYRAASLGDDVDGRRDTPKRHGAFAPIIIRGKDAMRKL
jgi:arginyl-tRNA--protein-N-Asp/Glu arginylyltransferase